MSGYIRFQPESCESRTPASHRKMHHQRAQLRIGQRVGGWGGWVVSICVCVHMCVKAYTSSQKAVKVALQHLVEKLHHQRAQLRIGQRTQRAGGHQAP